jgi:hypothetical protein
MRSSAHDCGVASCHTCHGSQRDVLKKYLLDVVIHNAPRKVVVVQVTSRL